MSDTRVDMAKVTQMLDAGWEELSMGETLSRVQLRTPEELCRRKRAYSTPREAYLAMRNLRRSTFDDPRQAALNVYHCEFCDKFHVGHARRG